jgi:hypothetical protein
MLWIEIALPFALITKSVAMMRAKCKIQCHKCLQIVTEAWITSPYFLE